MMKTFDPIFNVVKIIRTKQTRANNSPITVKAICVLLQPDLSKSLATTSLGKALSKIPSIKHNKHNRIHPLSHPISSAGISSISTTFGKDHFAGFGISYNVIGAYEVPPKAEFGRTKYAVYTMLGVPKGKPR